MRIGFISDIHIDYNEAYGISTLLLGLAHKESLAYLIIGGDISNGAVELPALVDLFKEDKTQLKFVPGNHDFYIEKKGTTSWDILEDISNYKEYLPGNNVETKEAIIVGNAGWYDYSFGPSNYTLQRFNEMRFSTRYWPDAIYCEWKNFNNLSLTEYFLKDIESQLLAASFLKKDIYVVTHMVPHDNFILHRPMIPGWDYNSAFFGTQKLHVLFKKYGVKGAFFGHTHFKYQENVDGIEYVSVPLGYSFEFDQNPDRPMENILLDKMYILEVN